MLSGLLGGSGGSGERGAPAVGGRAPAVYIAALATYVRRHENALLANQIKFTIDSEACVPTNAAPRPPRAPALRGLPATHAPSSHGHARRWASRPRHCSLQLLFSRFPPPPRLHSDGGTSTSRRQVPLLWPSSARPPVAMADSPWATTRWQCTRACASRTVLPPSPTRRRTCLCSTALCRAWTRHGLYRPLAGTHAITAAAAAPASQPM